MPAIPLRDVPLCGTRRETLSPYCILTSESLVLALQNARPAVERNYQVAISWSRHVQPRTKHSDSSEIVIKVTPVRGPRSRSHAVNAIYCFSLANQRAQPAAIERLVIVNDQVAISAARSTNPPRSRKMEATGGHPPPLLASRPVSRRMNHPRGRARLYGARNAVCKYGAADRLSPPDGSSR
jgi:hypothetical protein